MNEKTMGNQPIHAVDAIYFEKPELGTIGLTKREYFAGLAMQGLAAGVDEDGDPDIMANFAVQCADALIEQLKH